MGTRYVLTGNCILDIMNIMRGRLPFRSSGQQITGKIVFD